MGQMVWCSTSSDTRVKSNEKTIGQNSVSSIVFGRWVVSTTPCGPPLGGAFYSSVGGTAPIIFFCMENNPAPTVYPTLLPMTTYYFSINSAAPSGMDCGLSKPG